MPGTKRAISGTLPTETDEAERGPPAKKEELVEGEEDEFVEVELDQTPSPGENSDLREDAGPLHSPKQEENPMGGFAMKTGAKTIVVRKALPTPRLQTSDRHSKPSRPFVHVGNRARTRPQTLNQSGTEPVAKEECTEDYEQEEGLHECEVCDARLHSNMELLEHQRAFHKDHVTLADLPTGTLICSHPHCSASFPDVSHLIAHLVAFHSQPQYRIRKVTFDHLERFEHWQREMEQSGRCCFLAMGEQQGDFKESYRIDMYCEFCDEWRTQELKKAESDQDPNQVDRKFIGCPAHFSADIDDKNGRAVVVGCFAHLGHHKKLNWATLRSVDEGTRARTLEKICECGQVLRSKSAYTHHRRVAHEGVAEEEVERRKSFAEHKMPSLECGDPECDVMCDSMATLVQHVAQAHGRSDLTMEEYKFESLDEFEAWKTRVETETCSRFCKVSGRVLAHEVTKYYLCHLSGHPNRTKKKEHTPAEKQRNRPTKKMGRYCTAHINLRLNRVDNSVTIRGCFDHFGHNCDVRRLPVPENVRKEVQELLLKGIVEDDVVNMIKSKYSEEERGYWLQAYEVRNILVKMQREGLIPNIKNIPDRSETTEDDRSLLVDMGFTDYSHDRAFVPLEPLYKRNIQYKSVRQGRTISRAEMGASETRAQQRRYDLHLMDPVEVVQFVDEGSYAAEGLMEAREIEGDDQMYYDALDGVGMPLGEEELLHDVASTSMAAPSRKRMPLLKEPMMTGDPNLDSVVLKIKDRFINISRELKCTQDVDTAHSLLKELKVLQERMGLDGNEEELLAVEQLKEDVEDEVGHGEEIHEKEEHGYECIVNHSHEAE